MTQKLQSLAAVLGLAFLLVGGSCTEADLPAGSADPDASVGRIFATTQSITYVGKENRTNFVGYGQHLQYWPLFGRTSGTTARRTDDEDCIELTPSFSNFKHHYLPDGRTFSNDALGNPIGTKTRGGYSDWAIFTLPDGTTGRSGSFYDESNIDNSNNTVNQIKINVGNLTEFCLNLITDNTNGKHNPNIRFEARSDDIDLNLAGHPDHTFDGQTDMYTFRYQGMKEDDVFKIRMECSSASGCLGGGLGGFMVSDISTCTPGVGPDAGVPDAAVSDAAVLDAAAPETDAGVGDAGPGDPVDAGSDSTPDASATEMPDAGGNPNDSDAGLPLNDQGGCGCQSGSGGTTGTWLLLLAVFGLLCVRPRRSRVRSRGYACDRGGLVFGRVWSSV